MILILAISSPLIIKAIKADIELNKKFECSENARFALQSILEGETWYAKEFDTMGELEGFLSWYEYGRTKCTSESKCPTTGKAYEIANVKAKVHTYYGVEYEYKPVIICRNCDVRCNDDVPYRIFAFNMDDEEIYLLIAAGVAFVACLISLIIRYVIYRKRSRKASGIENSEQASVE